MAESKVKTGAKKATEKKAAVPAIKAETKPAVKKTGAAVVKKTAKPAVKETAAPAVKKTSAPAVKKSGAVTKTAETAKAEEKTALAPAAQEVYPVTETEVKPKAKRGRKPKATEAAKPAETPKKKRVLFVASEAWPFAGTGGLGEVVGSLPKALNGLGDVEAEVIIPLYESVPAEYREQMTFVRSINVPLAWRNQYCGLFTLVHDGVKFMFVDNEYYFKRSGLYGYGDDGERFAFFSRAVLELLPYLDYKPDILHCNDWHTALVPVYYKLFYQYREELSGIKTIFTIHNIEYQGQFSGDVIEDLFGISRREYMSVEYHGCINLMKAAIDYSDSVSTVSNAYAGEIMSAEYAHGLEGVLLKNAYKLKGILNGIDVKTYDPATSASLFKNYDAESAEANKKENKLGLQRMLNLPADENVPMIAMITRLASHKGLDIVRSAFNGIMQDDVQFVVLGTGDADHENFFRHMQNVYGNRVRAIIAFNKDMAQKIYAGADIFLMPSKSEPCGLSQMIAMRYGTVPVVRLTGGLKDSVTDCGDGTVGTGFGFTEYDAGALRHAVDRAVGLYRDYRDIWNGLRKRDMESDFSWNKSAKDYDAYYAEVLE